MEIQIKSERKPINAREIQEIEQLTEIPPRHTNLEVAIGLLTDNAYNYCLCSLFNFTPFF